MRKNEERFNALKYIQRREKAEAYYRFLKKSDSMKIQEHFHNIVKFGEERTPLFKIIAK